MQSILSQTYDEIELVVSQTYDENFVPLWGEPKFIAGIRHVNSRVVEELMEKSDMLVEDEKLRREIGRAGRQEVEKGKFSATTRNRKFEEYLTRR